MAPLFYIFIFAASASLTIASKCHYKGASYGEGETILLEEPCLSCTCRSRALVCALRVCHDLPNPPPQGCVILHKNNYCCPQLVCEEPGMRTIDSPNKPRLLNSTHGCLINGSVFSEGSALSSSSLCEFCYCIGGRQKCIKPHCTAPVLGCKPSYQQHSCCPTHYDCTHGDPPPKQPPKGCEMDGKIYPEGRMMPSRTLCENCYCMNGKPSCGPVRCTVQHLEGCYPVYTNGQCCPTAYNCTKMHEAVEMPVFSSNKLRSIETFNGLKSYQNKSKITTTIAPDVSGNTEVAVPLTTEKADVRQEASTETNQNTFENSLTTEITDVTDDTTSGTTEQVSTETVTDFTTTEEYLDTTTAVLDTASVSEEEDFTSTSTSVPETSTASYFPTEPPELNIITARDESYSINLSSNMKFDSKNRSSSGVQERKQPEEGVSNGTRAEEDYASYDYGEPELPPSLPNLVIYPFVAADAVTKDVTDKPLQANSKSDDDVGPVYYKNYFSPPKETEGGFIPKEEAILEIPMYEEKFDSEEKNQHQEPNIADHSIDLPTPTSETEHVTERSNEIPITGQQFPTFLPVTVAVPISITPNPFLDVIRTEPAPDLPSLMGDILPYLVDQQTKKPVSVNYKNVVIDYYPSHSITTTREDERKTTMFIEKSPVFSETTESINISAVDMTSTSPVYRPKITDVLYITTEYSAAKPSEVLLDEKFREANESEVGTTDNSLRRTSITPTMFESTDKTIEPERERSTNVPKVTSEKRPNIIGVKPKLEKTTKKPTTESDSFLNEFLKEFFESNTEVAPTVSVPPSSVHPKLSQKYSSKIREPIFTTSTAPSVELIENRGGEESNAGSFSLDSVFHMLFNSEDDAAKGSNATSTTTTAKPQKVRNGTKYTRKPITRKTKKPQQVTLPYIKSTSSPIDEAATTLRSSTPEAVNITEATVTSTSSTTVKPTFTTTQELLKTTIRGDSSFVTDENTGFPKINILQQDSQFIPNEVASKITFESATDKKVKPESVRKPAKLSGSLGSILKLAGCNIYGRMYRVGKIIAELSSPCLECMCTDSGVQCSQLVC